MKIPVNGGEAVKLPLDVMEPVWRGIRRAADLVYTIYLVLVFGVGLTVACGWLLGLSDSQLQRQFETSCAPGASMIDAPSRHLLLMGLGIGLGVTLWGAFGLRKWLLAMRRQ
jgi:hypothetical protein